MHNNQADRVLFCDSDRVTFVDRSSWGLLQFTGAERLKYLHNQSTNKFDHLQPGEGCQTVFVTSTARTLDLATTYVTEDGVLAIVSPQRREYLMKWLDRFIFPFDKVKLEDISSEFGLFTLLGEKSNNLLQNLGLNSLVGQPEGTHRLLEIENIPVRVAVGSDLAIPGYNLIFKREYKEKLQEKLLENGIELTSDLFWEQLRILQGRPASDRELTEDYNPLEAGLWHTISFDKGCYIGQETIARLDTYNGVKQKLYGIKLDREVAPPLPVTIEEKKVGMLTSCTVTPDGIFGLAYIKTKALAENISEVTVGESKGEIINIPFVKHPE